MIESDLRAAMLAECATMSAPASAAEAAVVARIATLPSVTVHRLPAALLYERGMRERACWENAPRFGGVPVIGWWHSLYPPGVYHAHVVVRDYQGRHWCVTPTLVPQPEAFTFTPDPIARGFVRHDPAAVIRAYDRLRARLLAGIDPAAAISAS